MAAWSPSVGWLRPGPRGYFASRRIFPSASVGFGRLDAVGCVAAPDCEHLVDHGCVDVRCLSKASSNVLLHEGLLGLFQSGSYGAELEDDVTARHARAGHVADGGKMAMRAGEPLDRT